MTRCAFAQPVIRSTEAVNSASYLVQAGSFAPEPVQIVTAAFGTYAFNSGGAGQASATDLNYVSNSIINTLHPGSCWTIGPVSRVGPGRISDSVPNPDLSPGQLDAGAAIGAVSTIRFPARVAQKPARFPSPAPPASPALISPALSPVRRSPVRAILQLPGPAATPP